MSNPGVLKPRILLLDIETFPNQAFVWGKYDQNVIRFTQQTCIATYVAKWLGKEKIFTGTLPQYKGYTAGSYDDKALVKDLWQMLDQADIVVAHNGDQFDVKVCNAAFIRHQIAPPSPYKTVDTKKAVKKVARFNSNALNDLGDLLNIGKKIKTDFDLWLGCINGDKKCWAQMLSYNRKDVLLLEQLYLRLLPWIGSHPNFTVRTGELCPKCDSSNVQWRGYVVTSTRRYKRFQCQNCGGWGRSVKSEGSAGTTNG